MKWSNEDVEYLKEHYIDDSRESLISKFNRTWKSIEVKSILSLMVIIGMVVVK